VCKNFYQLMSICPCFDVFIFLVSGFDMEPLLCGNMCVQAELEQIWKRILMEQGSEANLTDSLSEFYEQLIQVWQVQVRRTADLFRCIISRIELILIDLLVTFFCRFVND